MSKSNGSLPKPSKRYMRDSRWVTHNISRLTRKYANHWIAVYDGRVLAHGGDRGKVVAAARRKAQAADVVCQYIDDGTSIFSAFSTLTRPSR